MEYHDINVKNEYTLINSARILLNLFKAVHKIKKAIERRKILEIEKSAVIYYVTIDIY